jgi:hypothetical protein
MKRFMVGDRVRRKVVFGTDDVPTGIIFEIIANDHQLQMFDEYAVDFGASGVLIAFDNQLEAAGQTTLKVE